MNFSIYKLHKKKLVMAVSKILNFMNSNETVQSKFTHLKWKRGGKKKKMLGYCVLGNK